MSLFQKSLDTLEDFFLRADSGNIFECRSANLLSAMRQELLATFNQLLVWDRPALEASRGIHWPYEALQKRYPIFAELAGQSRESFRQKQALLFLAFLPFPRQWQWLLRAEKHYGNDPEVRRFTKAEGFEISRKIAKKPQNRYKLRHFCQFIKKPVSAKEKGVLRIFSLPYLFVMHKPLLMQLSQRYVLYVEPPMGIVFRHAWWRRFSQLEDPCLLGVPSEEDQSFLRDQEGVFAVPLAHGDFMEDLAGTRDFGVAAGPKEYDIVFNATYDDMERKRHALMLQLLGHPLLENTKALFLGRGLQASVEKFKSMVAGAGLDSRVMVQANLRRVDVPDQLARCKIGVHLSLYENACRGIYELLRSDLPCVIPSSMGGMSHSLFNDQTGMAVAEKELPAAISHAIRNRNEFRPREWFCKNSGSGNSSLKLNAMLRDHFMARGYGWEQDIVPLGSSGATRYVDPSHYRMFKEDFEWLLMRFNEVGDHRLSFSIE